MKVRTRFTLWISLAALTTAALCSFFVYHELVEEPYKLVDRELAEVAGTVFSNLVLSASDNSTHHLRHDDQHLTRYWLKILDSTGKIILVSPLAEKIDIPLPKDNKAFFLTRNIAYSSLWIDPDDMDELDEITDDSVRFRARLLTKSKGSEHYTLLIAKPLLFLDLELRELLTRLSIGIVVIIIFIFLVSYYLAGRILRPLTTINQEIREIRENSLDRRIPLGTSKDEVYVLSHSLNIMFDRLQHSFLRQKEFIGNAAHELKSPLTILMLGQEEMLAGRPPEPMYIELEKQLNTMRRLSKLIRNLLDISRLEQEETCNREPVMIHTLISQVLEDYKEILQARNIVIETHIEECSVLGDSEKLLRLIINLIDNAVKYTDATNGKIRITARKDQETTALIIANTGAEISAADLPHLFDQFYRVEKSRSQTYGGSGLGLTIAKRIVELHGGTLVVQSREGWITFSVTLPSMTVALNINPNRH